MKTIALTVTENLELKTFIENPTEVDQNKVLLEVFADAIRD
jgi:hypothetical protein